MYAVCDQVVDGYLTVVGRRSRRTSTRSRRRSSPPQRTNDSARIYILKREIAEVRRAVHAAARADAPVRRRARSRASIHEDAAPFFRDVLDHLDRVAEVVDGLDALLSTAFEAHLARISVQQNEDMRKISAGVGAGRRADPDRRHLRHELRPHARAAAGGSATRSPSR